MFLSEEDTPCFTPTPCSHKKTLSRCRHHASIGSIRPKTDLSHRVSVSQRQTERSHSEAEDFTMLPSTAADKKLSRLRPAGPGPLPPPAAGPAGPAGGPPWPALGGNQRRRTCSPAQMPSAPADLRPGLQGLSEARAARAPRPPRPRAFPVPSCALSAGRFPHFPQHRPGLQPRTYHTIRDSGALLG